MAPMREYRQANRGLDRARSIVEQACIDTRGISEATAHRLSARVAESLAVALDEEMELLLFRFETGALYDG